MGWFLHSRLVTHVCVLLVVFFAGLATFYYAWTFSRKWPAPTTTTGVIKGFAMTFHALFGFCSLLTWHSIRISSQSIMFGTWTTFGFASIVFDSWWFGLMVSRKGFDAFGSASRKGTTVAFCVYSGFYAVYRLMVMLFVFHFDVRYNEGLAATMGTSTMAPPPTVTTVAAPPVIQIAGPAAQPTYAAAAPAAAAHHHHPTYQYPLSQHTVSTLRSLAKKITLRRPRAGLDRRFARLGQQDDEERVGADTRDVQGEGGGVEGEGFGARMMRKASARRWWPRPRRAQGDDLAATTMQGQVPLIRVSLHQDSTPRNLHSNTKEEEYDNDHGVLFDAVSSSSAAGSSSFGSYNMISGSSAGSYDSKGVRAERGSSHSEEEDFSWDDDEEEDEMAAQRDYEERRRRRRQERQVNAPSEQATASAAPSNGAHSGPFKLEDHPVGQNGRKLRVAMIGSGFSGITAAIRLEQRLPEVEFDIFEKNHSVGGTWYENSYPGLCCDIPAHCYSLTFEPNPRWSHFYAYGPEILKYLQGVAAKYKLERFLRYGHKLVSAVWSEDSAQWHLTFDLVNEQGNKTGTKEVDVDVVIQGMGGLSRWDWPNIPGLQDFKGTKYHSAAYPVGADAEEGKRVAVIGSGSSAIQIVPAVAKYAKQLDNYVRGSSWIATPFASDELVKRSPDAGNVAFTEEEKERWATDADEYMAFRKNMERELNSVHAVTLQGSTLQTGAMQTFRELMEKKLAKKPHIAKAFIPNFAVGCRRLTPGPGYLEALCEDHVDFVSSPIERITETGIRCADGTSREYDTIICATGFDTSYRPRIPIIGRDGKNLQDLWDAPAPPHYLSMAAGPDYPNFFVVNGPNSALGSGSLLVLFEREVDYIVSCISKMLRENYRTMAVKQGAVDDWMEFLAAYFPTTVFGTKCRSWYKKGLEEGPVVALWPGSCLHAIETLRHPRWEDFDYTTASPQKNRFGWVGNGWSPTEVAGGDTAYYLDEIDYPPVPA
ncbi:hypothetical protein JCM10908_000381 [Rhodotorula pacifica]|uniref:flavin-containing monooxygenase n=1 Tax=Rhodotorula pacifica TaxID=1495444 RepID=UPI0031813804